MTIDDSPRATAAAFHSAVSLFARRARENKSGELSLPERVVLSRLDRSGPDTTAGLARWEDISPQAMGVTVSSLVGRGLIEKSADPSDGRRSILTITDSGIAVVRSARGELTDRIANALDQHFTADEVSQLRAATHLIERLTDLL